MHDLTKGAIKSAVAAACGLITGLPAIDPEHFNLITLNGIGHICIAVAWAIVVNEARFFNKWASNGKDITQ